MRPRLITFVIVLVGSLIIVNLIRSILTIRSRGTRLDDRQAVYEKLQQENKQLERKLIEVQNQQYIEKVAREKLGLALPGEQVVLLPQVFWENGASDSATVDSYADFPPWQQWMRLFF